MDTQKCEHLLAAAKTGDSNAVDQLLVAISDSLHSAATHRLGSSMQPRIDASDVVQQSLFEVSQSLSDFRGRTAAEWNAWTRRVLHHNVSNEIGRHFHARKRTVTRSQSFDDEGTEPRLFEYPVQLHHYCRDWRRRRGCWQWWDDWICLPLGGIDSESCRRSAAAARHGPQRLVATVDQS
jgi:hypothetical protein